MYISDTYMLGKSMPMDTNICTYIYAYELYLDYTDNCGI